MTLIEFVTQFYLPTLHASPRSKEQILSAIRQLNIQRQSETLTEDLSERMLLDMLQSLRDRNKSPATIKRRRGHLMSVWRYAYRKGRTQHNPWQADIPIPRGYKRKPMAWSVEQMNLMLEQARHVQFRMERPFCGKCWRALLQLLYYTGLRIAAVLQLKRSDLRGHILIVPAEIQKDSEDQIFRLPGDLVNQLLALPRPQQVINGRLLSELLIPWPWRLDGCQKILNRYILKPAGLPNDRRLKFHAIRRTVATIVAAKKGKEAARDILGHSDVATTERYLADPMLVHPDLPRRLSPMDVLPPLGDAC